MLSLSAFKNRVNAINKPFPSKTGRASYEKLSFDGETFQFLRINTKKVWSLEISLLYNIYKTKSYIDTSVVRGITGGRVNSPSVALLMAIKCIDLDGNRID